MNSTNKNNRSRKDGDKDGKALWKFMNNAVCHKKMENLRNRIDVRLISNKKDNMKWISKPSYMLRKIFDKNLVAIHKNEVTLTLNKATMLGYVFWIWAKYWCMSSIMYTLKINMIKAQDYYSHWYWQFSVWNWNRRFLWKL